MMPFPASFHALDATFIPAKLRFMERHYETKNDYIVRCIYPPLTDDQRAIAEANFRRFIQIAAEIQQELAAKPAAFDTAQNPTTMKERSNTNLQS